jgi:hypothetical protein
MNYEKIVEERRPSPAQERIARLIVLEINAAWADKTRELGKYKEVGYQADIGSPHQWWEENCLNYKAACKMCLRGRDLNTICLLAQALIDEQT